MIAVRHAADRLFQPTARDQEALFAQRAAEEPRDEARSLHLREEALSLLDLLEAATRP